MGLSAYEYSFGRGVQLKEDMADKIAGFAQENDIAVSAHAPYFINLANPDPQKREASFRYITDSARLVTRLGGDRVVVHVGAVMKLDREEAIKNCREGLKEAYLRLDDMGLSAVRLCPETMGRPSQIGDLKETLDFCLMDERLIPCVDFAHLHALGQGALNAPEDFEKALGTYRLLKQKSHMELCASHGLLTQEQFFKLKQAGVQRYHANIETSRRNFPNICTTHTFEDKLECIRRAKNAGLEVCSGGIIGMGETWEDRLDMALTLAETGVRSIPINALIPIKNTPLENLQRISEQDIVRTVAIFRFIVPQADIRLAAGRDLMSDCGRQAFLSGANSTITGDMLTTSGNKISQDIKMLGGIGFDTKRGGDDE
jgi:biotin synthase